MASKSTVHINPATKGTLRKAAGAKKGQNIPLSKLEKMKKGASPAMRKKIQFAENARKWKH